MKERRKEALGLLERFVAGEPEEAVEMADALLRLSELTWEVARLDYLDAFAAWQKTPEKNRKAEPPLPEYDRTVALYDRLLDKHPGLRAPRPRALHEGLHAGGAR